ncbi:ATP-binding protein [Desulfobacula sp.]|uniref:ATP-binding protein n=1 Tax=Desulfobacula sp. TaxID=2593537 RepID=UPI00263672F2|nr:ATP-binding protein [Desulfobacula sp.]
MNPEPIFFSVRSHPRNLKRIRRVITDALSKTDLSKKESTNIILAVDEACSNIIKHSYKNDHNRTIDLTIRQETHRIIISVLDDGIQFDIDSIEARKMDEIKPGGLGIYIIQQVMDTVEYSHTPEGFNKIKMVKQIPAPSNH